MTSSKIKYTTTNAIDNFNVGATLMRITCYVDCIEGLKELTKSNSKWIYKCILNNNGGKKVRIIFWGDDALQYNEKIEMYQILKITGGTIRPGSALFRRSEDTVLDREFQFGRGSTFEVLGTFDITNGAHPEQRNVVPYESIDMKNVCSARGPVLISAWVKELFRSISTFSGTSYGCGLICTDAHRMSVHVAKFVPKDELIEGVKVSVKGRIERRLDNLVLNCISMDDIAIIPGAPTMTEDQMDDAVEAPPLTLKRESSPQIESSLEVEPPPEIQHKKQKTE